MGLGSIIKGSRWTEVMFVLALFAIFGMNMMLSNLLHDEVPLAGGSSEEANILRAQLQQAQQQLLQAQSQAAQSENMVAQLQASQRQAAQTAPVAAGANGQQMVPLQTLTLLQQQLTMIQTHVQTKDAQIAQLQTQINSNNQNNNAMTLPVSTNAASRTGGFPEIGGPEWNRSPIASVVKSHPLINSWSQGHICWHDLLNYAKDDREVAQLGGNGKVKDRLREDYLIAQEIKAVNYLTMGDTAGFRREHGPMETQQTCEFLKDGCMIHSQSECMVNDLCAWCPEKELCMNYAEPYTRDLHRPHGDVKCTFQGIPKRQQSPNPPSPKTLSEGRLSQGISGGCDRVVSQPTYFVTLGRFPYMYYHWHVDGWQAIYSNLLAKGVPADHSDRNINIFINQHYRDNYPYFYFQLISQNCVQYAMDIQGTVCFENAHEIGPSGGKNQQYGYTFPKLMGISNVKFDGPRLGLMVRRRKRMIMNELELVAAAESMGIPTRLLPMEDMTFYEQIKAVQESTILAGIHGSGLSNAMFMHEDTVLFQIMPWRVVSKNYFKPFASFKKSGYLEWTVPSEDSTVAHFEFINKREIDSVLSRGSQGTNGGAWAFWINQDSYVDVEAFKNQLRQAMTMGINKQWTLRN